MPTKTKKPSKHPDLESVLFTEAEEAPDDVAAVIAELEDEMAEAAAHLEFEKAAVIRDQIDSLKSGAYKKTAQPGRRLRPTRAGSGAAG